ncbi:hypothetical protein [Fructobacillus tropaeoli]|uniref:Uncharacterized protein n=1 Tax=Fructobacillus tropaeoli TaxID=709323 RepID=A0A3F3HH16_9LACO|nr:hypothetical protein [Fructobacillus tropaeoli]GAP04879.1 hypothetical protein FTRO_0110140 [Fructobacillus tropaeoli]
MASNIRFYMTNFKNETFEFPLNPSELEFKRSSGNDKEKVVALGEIVRLASGVELGQTSINFTLPLDLSRRKSYWTSGNLTWRGTRGGEAYLQFLDDVFQNHEIVRVVFTNTAFNDLFVIDDFSYKLSGGGDEYEVSITLTQWRDYSPMIVKRNLRVRDNGQEKKVEQQQRPAPPAEIGLGTVVIVNGQLHRDSNGGGPGQTEVNARRKVNFIADGRQCPYHVTDMEGGWRGWVTAESVRAE